MRDPRIVASFLQRGCVWLFFHVPFPDGLEKPKYCVVMENAEPESILGLETVIVALTTSHVEFAYKPWTVTIPAGTVQELKGDSLVDLTNYLEVSVEKFHRSNLCRYIGRLPDNIMVEIDKALEHATAVLPDIILRMRPRV